MRDLERNETPRESETEVNRIGGSVIDRVLKLL